MTPMKYGILPRQNIKRLADEGVITAAAPLDPLQIQPASLDLRLGLTAYRIRASFLPGKNRTIQSYLDEITLHTIDMTSGAVLETGCIYLVPLQERLNLPDSLSAAANPKSSTGRLDVFTRVIGDHAEAFDQLPKGYSGPLYVEIAPRTFSILVRPEDRLVQLRFRRGATKILRTQHVSINLKSEPDNDIIGWRARRHAGLVDISRIGSHPAHDYWEPVRSPQETLVLDPDEFYILASSEAVGIPETQAAEMAPIATEIGEFRAHYAGFFDPGFGGTKTGGAGSRAVLEVRGRDVPFLLRHGQPVAKLVFEPMTSIPDQLYGSHGSHYQAQGLRLSKHFSL